MDYWQAILQEVLHKDDPDYPCYFTNIRETSRLTSQSMACSRRDLASEFPKDQFLISDVGPEKIYFTYRESQSLGYILRGMNIRETAEQMGLSPRTVEYYIKNMRVKLNLSSKEKLLEKAKELALDLKLLKR